jgi:hypothetical protein
MSRFFATILAMISIPAAQAADCPPLGFQQVADDVVVKLKFRRDVIVGKDGFAVFQQGQPLYQWDMWHGQCLVRKTGGSSKVTGNTEFNGSRVSESYFPGIQFHGFQNGDGSIKVMCSEWMGPTFGQANWHLQGVVEITCDAP